MELIKIGQMEDFDEVLDNFTEALNLDFESGKITILPRIKSIEKYLLASNHYYIIGKWIIIFDLTDENIEDLEINNLMPYYGLNYKFSDFK